MINLKNGIFIVAFTLVIALGDKGCITAEAASCPPHTALVDRYLYAETPSTQSHIIFVFNPQTNGYTAERCSYSVQNIYREIYCTDCSSRVSTYVQTVEYHMNSNCPKRN